nr:hypothetical protein [uncultured Desulfuromonas sp.]
MRASVFAIVLILVTLNTALCYEYADYIRDAATNPQAILDNLHPESVQIVKEASERLRNDEEYRESVFFPLDAPNLKGKSDREIWGILWEKIMEDDYYEDMVLVESFDMSRHNLKIYLAEDPSFKKLGGLYETIIFKKHEGRYYPLLPEMIVISLFEGI